MTAVLLLLAAMAGCGSTRPQVPRTEFIAFSPEQKTQLQGQTTRAYRLQEGDLLKVYFAYENNLNQDGVVVLNDGSINLVGIDRVQVAGLSIAEADSIVTLAYSREYREPSLSIMIQETLGRRVYVLGEVHDPGYYKVPMGGMDVMSAISMASGFTEDAAREGTLIVRVTRDGYQFQEVDLTTFGTADFAATSTAQLQSYDIIYVPRSRVGDFAYFAKAVLTGVGNITQIAYDLRYIMTGDRGGF